MLTPFRRPVLGLAGMALAGVSPVADGRAATSAADASAGGSAGVAAAIRPVQDQVGKATVIDNYRWMEDTSSAETKAYLHAATAEADRAIGRIAGRDKLLRDIAALDAPGPTISALTPDGETLYYLKRGPADDVARLVLRRAAGGMEKTLVDPEMLADARPHSEIDQFVPSLDGNYVAYGLEYAGPDTSTLRVYDAVRNTTLSERIEGARFAQVTWRPDSAGFYYTRAITGADIVPGAAVAPAVIGAPGASPHVSGPAGASPTGASPISTSPTVIIPPAAPAAIRAHEWGHLGVFLHMLGDDTSKDALVLDGARLPFPFAGDSAIPRLLISPGSENALAIVSDGVSPDLAVATAPVSQLALQPAPWQLVAAQKDGVTQLVVSGSLTFMLSRAGAPALRVMAEDLADPGFEHARVVVPETEGVITGIAAASDALYVARRQGAAMHLLRQDYHETTAQDVRLPFAGTIAPVYGVGTAREWGGLVADPRSPGALFSLESWDRPLVWMRFDTRLRRAEDMGLLPDPKIDGSQYSTIETTARAEDGTQVPLSIIARKDVAVDHARPALVDAYGSYGYAYDPRFLPQALAWADQGGVFAVAHVRGGGELGEAWHASGTLARKTNAASDLLACAAALIKLGYTDQAHLAGMGTNAGALAIGNAITRQPGMFRAALIRAGLTNPLRTEPVPGHDINILELGSVHIPLQQAAVLSVDPYAQVQDGVAYPAVLLTGAVDDSREPVWEAAKMAARLRAASTSGRPILLRVAFDEGRDGPTRAQRDAAQADELSFLLWQLGAPGFAPGGEAAGAHRGRRHRP